MSATSPLFCNHLPYLSASYISRCNGEKMIKLCVFTEIIAKLKRGYHFFGTLHSEQLSFMHNEIL